MRAKLYNYEQQVLYKLFEYCFADIFDSYDEFLSYYPWRERSIDQTGEYLILKHIQNNNEEDVNLCDYTVSIESDDLKNGAEFIAWIGKNSILIEGYSFEDRWLRADSKVIIKGVERGQQ